MANPKELNIAILIDADNVSHKKIKNILNEVKRYGVSTIKRIYGDWTSPYVENWKESLLTHAITPIQQYSYTQGKNSTDSALIIDAMDILHSDKVDGFCIVSSDSDFTRLATRLRESGKLVIGVGERKTPKPFIASCDKFIYVEILEKPETEKNKKAKPSPMASPAPTPKSQESTPIIQNQVQPSSPTTTNNTTTKEQEAELNILDEETLILLKDAVDDTADESGWASLGETGSLILKRKPDFDSRNYGYEKMSHLFKSMKEDFDIEERSSEKSKIKHFFIRNIIVPKQQKQDQTTKEKESDKKPISMIIPSPGNKITADDVKNNKIRITKNFKPLFPKKSTKLKIKIKTEHECSFSYRGDRSHVLSLGKEAATELGLEEGSNFKITKLADNKYSIQKQI